MCRVWRGLYYDGCFLSDRYPCIWSSFLCYFYVSSILCQASILMRSFINRLRTIHGSITDDRFGLVWDKNIFDFFNLLLIRNVNSTYFESPNWASFRFHVKKTSLWLENRFNKVCFKISKFYYDCYLIFQILQAFSIISLAVIITWCLDLKSKFTRAIPALYLIPIMARFTYQVSIRMFDYDLIILPSQTFPYFARRKERVFPFQLFDSLNDGPTIK